MKQLVTIGETMVSFVPQMNEAICYGTTFKMRIAGAESNTAIGVRKLGIPSSFITRLGDDSFGQYILRMIRAEDVDTSHVILDDTHPTGIMFKELIPHKETMVHYYRSDSAASYMDAKRLPEALIANAGILHFTGITPVLSESCRDTIFQAVEIASAGGCSVSFDPNIRWKLWRKHDYTGLMRDLAGRSDYLLLGLEEAGVLYGVTTIDQIIAAVFSNTTPKLVAIKDGSNGAWVCDREQSLYIPPVKCCCIDPVGAGDAFNAGLLSGILKGEPLSVCGSLAAISGARATETSGDIEGLATEQEIRNVLNGISEIQR